MGVVILPIRHKDSLTNNRDSQRHPSVDSMLREKILKGKYENEHRIPEGQEWGLMQPETSGRNP